MFILFLHQLKHQDIQSICSHFEPLCQILEPIVATPVKTGQWNWIRMEMNRIEHQHEKFVEFLSSQRRQRKKKGKKTRLPFLCKSGGGAAGFALM